jgi:hypothetical protein
MALKKTTIVPNRNCEFWDLSLVSKNENYAIAGAVGLSNLTATDWASYAGDITDKTIAYNVKTYTNLWDGRPTGTTKKARNMNIHKGPVGLMSTAGGAFNYNWVSFSYGNASGTMFQRLDNPSITINPATVFPAQAAFFNQFRDRFMGHFDAAGSPVVAVESSINQISVWKASIGTPYVFTGYSPIFLNSNEFVGLERLVADTGNVVFYTKDTTGQTTNKFARRGTTIYCRCEVDNYLIERTVVSSLDIKFLMQTWFIGTRSYIVYNDSTCNAKTLESANYPYITEEQILGTVAPQSILISTVVKPGAGADLTLGSTVAFTGVTYLSVVISNSQAESMSVATDLTDIIYVLVVVSVPPQEDLTLASQVAFNFVNYEYDPVTPIPPATIINVDVGTEQILGTMTPQSILYV